MKQMYAVKRYLHLFKGSRRMVEQYGDGRVHITDGEQLDLLQLNRMLNVLIALISFDKSPQTREREV